MKLKTLMQFAFVAMLQNALAQVPTCSCDGDYYTENYTTGWTSAATGATWAGSDVCPGGSLDNANFGSVQSTGSYIEFNSARDGATNKAYKDIGPYIPSNVLPNTWTIEFTFTLKPVVQGHRPTYFPGHDIFIVSANSSDLQVNTTSTPCGSCVGCGPTNNDAIWISLDSDFGSLGYSYPPPCPTVVQNGPNSSYFSFSAHSRDGSGSISSSNKIPLGGPATYYLRLQRNQGGQGFLSVFTDAGHTALIATVPFCIDPNIGNLHYVQHSVGVLGDCNRTLDATIKDMTICDAFICPPELSPSFTLANKYCYGDQIIAVPVPIVCDSYSWLFEETDIAGNPTSPHIFSIGGNPGSPQNTSDLSNTPLYDNGIPGPGSTHFIQCNHYYSITLSTSLCGVIQSVKRTFYVKCLPKIDAGDDQMICMGESAQLNGSEVGSIHYEWSPASSLNASVNILDPIATPTVSTTYTFTVIGPNGCTATDQVSIGIWPVPYLDAGSDELLCSNPGSFSIGSFSNPTTLGMTYDWSIPTGSSAFLSSYIGFCNGFPGPYHCPRPYAIVTSTTTFTLTQTDENGCVQSDQVTLFIAPDLTADAGDDKVICLTNPTLVSLGGDNTSTGTGITYSWTPTTGIIFGATNAGALAAPTTTTVYTLTVTYTGPNGQTCTATDQVTVSVGNPTADAGSNINICPPGSGAIIYCTATGGNINWSPTTGLFPLSNPNICPVITNPSIQTNYTLTVTDPATGCEATDVITVSVGCPAPMAIDQGSGTGSEISVFPNPVEHSFTIKSDIALNNVSVELTDITGRRIYVQQYNTLTEVPVDISAFEAGIYYLNIRGDKGLYRIEKIIKN
jgi:hypothetical protein